MALALMVVVVGLSVTGAVAMQGGQSDWDPNMGSGRGSYTGGGYVRDAAGCWHVADPREVWGTSSRDDKKLKLTPRRKEVVMLSRDEAMDRDLGASAAAPAGGKGNADLLRQCAGTGTPATAAAQPPPPPPLCKPAEQAELTQQMLEAQKRKEKNMAITAAASNRSAEEVAASKKAKRERQALRRKEERVVASRGRECEPMEVDMPVAASPAASGASGSGSRELGEKSVAASRASGSGSRDLGDKGVSSESESDEGGSVISVGSTDSTARGKYSCMRCDASGLQASSFLLLIEENKDNMAKLLQNPSWCGRLWGTCFACSEKDAKSFTQAVRGAWNLYRRYMGKKCERVRDLKYRGERALVERRAGTTMTNTQKRKLAIARILNFVKKLAEACSADPWYKMQSQLNVAEYCALLEKCKENPGFVPSTDGKTLKAPEIQYLTQVCEGLSVSFLCRHCGFYGLNSQWVKHANRELFRCPACGAEFKPWAFSTGQKIAAQKCVSWRGSDGRTWVFPATWAGSEEDRWLNRQVEIRAEQVKLLSDPEAIEAFAHRNVEKIDALALKYDKPPNHFALIPWRKEVEWRLDGSTFPRSNWQHLTDGFYGGFLDLSLEWDVFDDWEEIIGLFANCLAAGRQLSRM
jgi:hypothetical protein